MATKLSEKLENALTVLFTSVAAPILVGLANHVINDGSKETARANEPTPPATAPFSAPPVPVGAVPPPAVAVPPAVVPVGAVYSSPERLIIDAVATTRDDAVRLARRDALVRAAAAEVGPTAWSAQGTVLTAILVREEPTLITDCREMTGRTEWRLRGSVYHATVAVDVNRAALVARLQSFRPPGRW